MKDAAVRRYLLGEAEDEEREALEREYLGSADALDRIEATEEQLIEAYLAGELDAHERAQFEREYMASPERRRRVETIRGLSERAGAMAPSMPRARRRWTPEYFAIAASLLLAVLAGWWFITFGARERQQHTAIKVATERPLPASSPDSPRGTPPLHVVALTLSPITTRSAGETTVPMVSAGTDSIVLDLQADRTEVRIDNPRAAIQTVEGKEIWRGAAEKPPATQPSAAARVVIPAAKLVPGDYVVLLFDASQERYRYFFRVQRAS